MQKFYEVLGLKSKVDFFQTEGALEVILTDELLRSRIFDDIAVSEAKSRGEYIWISGGGTYLINNQYLLLVKRPHDAIINPGRYSLFSGRANDKNELINPVLLVRELFEELVLFDTNYLYYPINNEYQKIIDQVYSGALSHIPIKPIRNLDITSVDLINNALVIRYKEKISKYLIPFHINELGEINILFLFSATLDVENLFAEDGESFHLDGKIARQNREIYLYDLSSGNIRNITASSSELGRVSRLDENLMTDHLAYMLKMIKKLFLSNS
jgi:hypothetical protein